MFLIYCANDIPSYHILYLHVPNSCVSTKAQVRGSVQGFQGTQDEWHEEFKLLREECVSASNLSRDPLVAEKYLAVFCFKKWDEDFELTNINLHSDCSPCMYFHSAC